jgi:hypothetical protein
MTLAARPLDTHGRTNHLGECPTDEGRCDERADHRGLARSQLVEPTNGLEHAEEVLDGPAQTIEGADGLDGDAIGQVRRAISQSLSRGWFAPGFGRLVG